MSYQLLLSWSCSQVSSVICEVILWAISYCYLDLVVRYHRLCVRCLCELSAAAVLILLSGIISCVWGVSVSYQLLPSWSCSQVSPVVCEVSLWGVSVSYQLLPSWSCSQVSPVVCEVSLWAISCCHLDLVVRYHQLCVRCLCELSATAIMIL